jgi:Tfp pilus assembly protein PilV
MLHRLRAQRGQGMVEMIVTMVVISVALLTLAAAYDQAFFSLHQSARKSAAANLAEQQLELMSTLQYSQLGLSSTLLATVKASDPTYVSDGSSLAGTEVSQTCGTYAFCMPVQCNPAATCSYPVTLTENPTGSDGRHYKVETFVRKVSHTLWSGSSATTYNIVVTVIVRDPNQASSPIVYQASAGFDCGQRTGSCT